MSTPRKNYFLGPTEILRLPWPKEIKYAYLMLSAAMVDRWRSDNLDRLDAEHIVLSRGLLYDVTGCEHATHARRRLLDLASRLTECRGELGEMSIEPRGDLTAIHWRNLADFQQLPPGRRAKAGPDEVRQTSESASASASASASSSDRSEKSSSIGGVSTAAPPPAAPPAAPTTPGTASLPGLEPPKRRPKVDPVKTIAPEELPPEDYEKLETWCRKKRPAELPFLPEHVEACLDHFRTKRELRAEWWRTCRTWVRNARKFEKTQRPGDAPRMAEQRKQTPEEIRRAARELNDADNERSAYGD